MVANSESVCGRFFHTLTAPGTLSCLATALIYSIYTVPFLLILAALIATILSAVFIHDKSLRTELPFLVLGCASWVIALSFALIPYNFDLAYQHISYVVMGISFGSANMLLARHVQARFTDFRRKGVSANIIGNPDFYAAIGYAAIASISIENIALLLGALFSFFIGMVLSLMNGMRKSEGYIGAPRIWFSAASAYTALITLYQGDPLYFTANFLLAIVNFIIFTRTAEDRDISVLKALQQDFRSLWRVLRK
tara:strand:+ start:544 stop:1299 length:756 start_codon:yes stop_codon:yes gene_type:complete